MSLKFRNGAKHTSPVVQLIDTATDPGTQSTENWALFMNICDAINASEDGPKDAVKAIRKRFALKVPSTTVLTLKLLETCVKNCGKRFHIHIATKEFMQDMVKIISPKYNPSVELQNQVLGLIQTWACAFQSSPDLREVNKIYQELKTKGVEFPPLDPDLASQAYIPEKSAPPVAVTEIPVPRAGRTLSNPIYPTGQKSTQHGVAVSAHHVPHAIPIAERVAKLRSELATVQQNCRVFGELLTEMSSSSENTADLELLEDLNSTCRQMQKRIVELIEAAQIDQITEELLSVNDELNNVFLRYDRFQRLRAGRGAANPSPVQPPHYAHATADLTASAASVHAYPPVQESHRVADISVPAPSYQPPSQPTASAVKPTSASGTNDAAVGKLIDFDNDAETTPGYPTASMNALSLGGPGAAAYGGGSGMGHVGAPEVKPLDRESDFAEMEQWLNTGSFHQETATATSNEFEQFLSQRAHEAERVPDSSRNQKSDTSSTEPFML